jgi:lysophospholipase L1-like esterase
MALNEWIRTGNLHPSDAGYQAMANAIDLSLFGTKNTVASAR